MISQTKYIHMYSIISSSEPEAVGRAYFGEGEGAIFLENVQCNGSEDRLQQCPASPLGVHDCDHTEDAGVKCRSTYIRIYSTYICV